MEHLMRIEFTESGPWGDTERIALFDDRLISSEEAIKVLDSGEHSPFIIVCTREQFINVFSSLLKSEGYHE